jgi:putative copper resistance protein D
MTAEDSTRRTNPPRARWSILVAFAASIGSLVAYAVSSGQTSPAEIVGYCTATGAGAVCLGGLIYVLITACPDERGVLDPPAFRAHLLIERIAPLWLIAALTMVVVQSAADAAVPPARVLSSGLLGSAIGASESARAWVVVAFCAAVLTVALRQIGRAHV